MVSQEKWDKTKRLIAELEEMVAVAREASAKRVRHEDEQRVQCFDASMKNCYGLKALHSYFNVPYLELKIATLAELARSAREELLTVRQEVAV